MTQDTPKLWRDMTPEEKGALLLAHYEGKAIEAYDFVKEHWFSAIPRWSDPTAYRVKPEPKRETVKLRGGFYRSGLGCEFKGWSFDNDWMCEGGHNHSPSHRITFDLVDGEPDCDSIKMDRIK